MIRHGTVSDLEHLPDIERRAAQRLTILDADTGGLHNLFSMHVTSIETFADYVRAGCLWVAEKDEQIVGFISVSIIENNLHIDEIDVLPEYGRQGIGRALIDVACEWGREHYLSLVTLSTQSNLPWNQPYYAKLGFVVMPPEEWTEPYKQIRKHEAALGFPMQDRLLMYRQL